MKKCFKCNGVKDLSEFYRHKQMGDGHLNKCKDCTRKDAALQLEKNKQNPEWVEKEKERVRLKPLKLKGKPRTIIYAEMRSKIASGEIIKLPCAVCGNAKSQGHHEDYSKPFDLVWLCVRHHQDRHIHLRNAKTLGQDPMPINYFIKSLQVTIP
jgi:hypothetical protein